MNLLKKKHTSCKDCIFATYQSHTQIGCSMDRLELMKKYNIEILEAYDDHKKFYIINDLNCAYYRTKLWIYAQDKWSTTTEIYQTQQQQIQKEIALKYHAIIFTNNNLEAVKQTLLSLNSQQLLPTKVTIVRPYDSLINRLELLSLCHTLTIPWKIENLVQPYTDNEIIDIVVNFVKTDIYAVFYAGFIMPSDIFSTLNDIAHNQFLSCVMLLPNSANNGLIVSQKIHNLYQGNRQKPLKLKLEEDQCPHIFPIHQILPNFPK
jgi:hypothetical protein